MTIFEVLKPHIGKRIDDVIENTAIEQHRSAKTGETESSNKVEFLIVFEDGARVVVR